MSQRRGRSRFSGISADVSRQLREKKRTPAGLARDSEPLSRPIRLPETGSASRERLRFRVLMGPSEREPQTVGARFGRLDPEEPADAVSSSAKAEQRQQGVGEAGAEQFLRAAQMCPHRPNCTRRVEDERDGRDAICRSAVRAGAANGGAAGDERIGDSRAP